MKIALVSVVLSLYCHLGMSQGGYEQAPSLEYLLTSDPSSSTDLAYSNEGLIADDFQFSQSTAINTIRWWGHLDNGYPGQLGPFQLALWTDAGHGPDSLISELQISSLQAVPTGRSFFSGTYDEYYYQAVLETPFIAQSQVHYWLSIGDATSVAGNWRWESGSDSMYPGAWQRNGGIWNQQHPGEDMAFELAPETVMTNLAPMLQSSPLTQTVEVGGSLDLSVRATLSVRAIGLWPFFYLWYFNNTNFIGSYTNSHLQLTNLQFSQSGVGYTVVVTNAFGAVTSSPAILNVIPAVQQRAVAATSVTGETGSSVNVGYADNLGPPWSWQVLDTVSLTNTPQNWFDLSTPLPPQRFYRVWQTGTPAVLPSLKLISMVPAITVTGNIGNSVRLDYINAIGPTNAWVTLDTVTLNNTSQLYFDVSAPGRPKRLYRLVQIP